MTWIQSPFAWMGLLNVTTGLFSAAAGLIKGLTDKTPIPPKDLSADYRTPLPKEGLVPDKETAIKIAEVVLFRLYGEQNALEKVDCEGGVREPAARAGG